MRSLWRPAPRRKSRVPRLTEGSQLTPCCSRGTDAGAAGIGLVAAGRRLRRSGRRLAGRRLAEAQLRNFRRGLGVSARGRSGHASAPNLRTDTPSFGLRVDAASARGGRRDPRRSLRGLLARVRACAWRRSLRAGREVDGRSRAVDVGDRTVERFHGPVRNVRGRVGERPRFGRGGPEGRARIRVCAPCERPLEGCPPDHRAARLHAQRQSRDVGGGVARRVDDRRRRAVRERRGRGGVRLCRACGGWKDASVLPTNMLHAADSTGNDALGASVAIAARGGTIVAGAPGWSSEQGAIYLFKRGRNGWGHTDPLGGVWAPVGEADGNSAYGGVFGLSVAMSANADTIVVGAPFENGWEGGVYVFKRSHGRYLGTASCTTSRRAQLTAFSCVPPARDTGSAIPSWATRSGSPPTEKRSQRASRALDGEARLSSTPSGTATGCAAPRTSPLG
jgi:hypothetical protein